MKWLPFCAVVFMAELYAVHAGLIWYMDQVFAPLRAALGG